nr:hypothetical protein [Rhodococcus koreensis]
MGEIVERRNRSVDLDTFRASVIDSFVPLETSIAPDTDFEGYIHGTSLGQVQVAEVVASAHTVRRTPRTIRASDPGFYKVGLQVRGYCVLTQDDREAALTRVTSRSTTRRGPINSRSTIGSGCWS